MSSPALEAARFSSLRGIKGRFVLSSFPHPLLDEAARAAGWRVAEKAQAYCLQERKGEKKRELLAANYPFALEGWEQTAARRRAWRGMP